MEPLRHLLFVAGLYCFCALVRAVAVAIVALTATFARSAGRRRAALRTLALLLRRDSKEP